MADDTISNYFDYEQYDRDICIERDVFDNGKTIFVMHQKGVCNMKDNKNSIEMIIYVSNFNKDNKGTNERVKLDLMNPAEAKSKYEAFQKEMQSHQIGI